MHTQQTPNILLVEDDENLGYLLKENLESRGFEVTICADGKYGFQFFNRHPFHICILDIMLPNKDGFMLAKEIRAVNESVPIVFLSSRSMELDKIRGFEVGCDDYITKPFSIMELLLRINAILKRTTRQESKEKTTAFSISKYTFDSEQRKLIYPDGSEKSLTAKEAELLKQFCERKNELIPRQYLMNKVWGSDDYYIAKSMDVFITRLRKLLKEDASIEIQNLYGIGFKLVVKTSPSELTML